MRLITWTFLLTMLLGNSFASKINITSPNAPGPLGAYSQVTKLGNMVYISNQLPLDPDTGVLVSGGIKAQIRQVFENINALILAAGGTMDDIVTMNVYATSYTNMGLFNDVIAEKFTPPYPARSVVVVSMLHRNALFEVSCVAQLSP